MKTKQLTKEDTNEVGFNLIEKVANLLTAVGLHKEVLSFYYTNPWIIEAQKFPVEGQRFLLNRYWNQQLLNCEINTVSQRCCLIPDGLINDWLRLFEGKILPICVEYNLPVQL